MQFKSNSPEDTQKIALQLLALHPKNRIWLLYGDLAAGKTTFVKGFAQFFKVNQKEVKSPTFTLLNEYEEFKHYDLYRLGELGAEIEESLREHINGDSHLIVEWPELIEEQIKAPHLKIYFSHKGGDEREIRLLEL